MGRNRSGIIWTDIRFAVRQLRLASGFAITTILTLALGIAGTVAIFGLVDSALIRPLPYTGPSRLVGVFETSPLGGQRLGYAYPNFRDLEHGNNVFASIAAYADDNDFLLTDAGGGVHEVNGAGVTGSFFRVLGVRPILGTDFVAAPTPEDLTTLPPSVILSHAAWQNWFGGRPDVLGKTVTLSGDAYTVIGVLPASFQFAPTGATEFWTTLRPFAGEGCFVSRGCTVMHAIARLMDGVTVQQAFADVGSIALREAREHPDPDRDRRANVVPLSHVIVGDIQPILLMLLGGAGLLLLIAYVNVAGLLLVRSEIRRREFAVRGALGAGRARLIRQFVTEGCVTVAVSSSLGLFAAALTQRLLLRLIPEGRLNTLPFLQDAGWNWHVAAFATAVVLIACALFALTPALRLSLGDLRAGLGSGARGTSGPAWQHVGARLVVLELATTMVLLAGAGLLGKSLYRLLHVDFGFAPNHLATLWMLAPDPRYADRARALALQRDIVGRLQSVPGVTAAGMSNELPVGGVPSTQIGFVGRPSAGVTNEVGHRRISAGYLSVLKATLLRGRYFDAHDDLNAPLVAVINQTLARRYFQGENPVGKQFFYHGHGSDPLLDGSEHPTQIVGVIADIREYALDGDMRPVIYTPYEQGPATQFWVTARSSRDPASVLPSLIAAIHTVDPGIVTSSAATMSQVIQDSGAAYLHRASAWLAAGFALLALLLSTVGIYGVTAYSVTQRTREIGIRMALGATQHSVYQLILKKAARLTLLGVVAGLLGSVAAGRFMGSLLFGVRSWDVSILSAVAAALLTSALLASYIPARRAAAVDPMESLRAE